MMAERVIVAMSGGVDSSVAAYLCKNEHYDCLGVTMRLFIGDLAASCCTEKDIEDAQNVAERLGIPYRVLDFTDRFEQEVISRFISAYEKGDTPNPCIDCNRHIKFRQMLDTADRLGYDKVATGHYARIAFENGRYLLKKGADQTKDQSYVLYSLTQEQLAHTLFPLGAFSKSEIRQMAEENRFVNANKHDSQDICFVPDGDYAAFIVRHTGKTYPEGDFVDMDGNILGRHKGIIRYTNGQRKGLGLALPAPMYVYKKDMDKNQVILCNNEQLFSRSLDAEDFNWIAGEVPQSAFKASVRIRYNQTEQPALVIPTSDTTVRIEFEQPQRAVTSGQAAVIYDGDTVIGGGKIV